MRLPEGKMSIPHLQCKRARNSNDGSKHGQRSAKSPRTLSPLPPECRELPRGVYFQRGIGRFLATVRTPGGRKLWKSFSIRQHGLRSAREQIILWQCNARRALQGETPTAAVGERAADTSPEASGSAEVPKKLDLLGSRALEDRTQPAWKDPNTNNVQCTTLPPCLNTNDPDSTVMCTTKICTGAEPTKIKCLADAESSKVEVPMTAEQFISEHRSRTNCQHKLTGVDGTPGHNGKQGDFELSRRRQPGLTADSRRHLRDSQWKTSKEKTKCSMKKRETYGRARAHSMRLRPRQTSPSTDVSLSGRMCDDRMGYQGFSPMARENMEGWENSEYFFSDLWPSSSTGGCIPSGFTEGQSSTRELTSPTSRRLERAKDTIREVLVDLLLATHRWSPALARCSREELRQLLVWHILQVSQAAVLDNLVCYFELFEPCCTFTSSGNTSAGSNVHAEESQSTSTVFGESASTGIWSICPPTLLPYTYTVTMVDVLHSRWRSMRRLTELDIDPPVVERRGCSYCEVATTQEELAPRAGDLV
eukprot:GHVT01096801.1.p1 GENE.GHVT01096801.1~~GHVT01096801.1.p1  ORF type:complete len:534 (-),score=8.22 GHVT01096801.1:665-2266(-)